MSASQSHSRGYPSHTNQQPMTRSLHGKVEGIMESSVKETELVSFNSSKASDCQRNSSTHDKSGTSTRTGYRLTISNLHVRTLPDNLMRRPYDRKTWLPGPDSPASQVQSRRTGCESKTDSYHEWGSYEPTGKTKEARKWDAISEDDKGDLE